MILLAADEPFTHLEECPECKGTGRFDDGDQELTYSECDGTGEIEVEDED